MSYTYRPPTNNNGEGGGGDIIIPLSDSITSDSTTTAASSLAVKTVNDKFITKADVNHDHNNIYYSKLEVDNKINTSVPMESELYTIKASPEDTAPSYLNSKVDNVTVVVEGNEIKVKAVDGLIIGITNINDWLNGTEGNIQTQINDIKANMASITSGMQFKGKFETKADLNIVTNMQNGDVAVVLVDESRAGQRSLYVYSDTLGMWDFVGAFEFSDTFIALSDTPSSYIGNDRKFAKVDETNEKIVFGDVDWSEIQNKPSSTITQIDDAVTNRHVHDNLSLLQTYTNTNIDISNAVSNTHNHSNKSGLDKLDVNENNELTINGVVYTPNYALPQKEYLYARRITSNQTLTLNSDLIFNSKVSGSIPYNTATGAFTLTQGKVYRISVNPLINLKEWIRIAVVDSATNTRPSEANNGAIIDSVTLNLGESGNSGLELIISPSSTREFKVRCDGMSTNNTIVELRNSYSTLIIHEL